MYVLLKRQQKYLMHGDACGKPRISSHRGQGVGEHEDSRTVMITVLIISNNSTQVSTKSKLAVLLMVTIAVIKH